MFEHIDLPRGEKMHESRWLFYFMHKTKMKEFGPYEDADEAASAFQSRYGYWPGDPLDVRPYAHGSQK